MTLDTATVQDLIKKLEEDRSTYLEAISRTHELLAKALEAQTAEGPQTALTNERLRRNTGTTLATTTTDDVVTVSKDSNFSVEDDSDTDDDEALYVQHSLPTERYDEEGLRRHIREYPWTEADKSILRDVVGNHAVVNRDYLFSTRLGPVEDRSHLSHYSIFDGSWALL